MLALTPQPLLTAGERALFAELARWDTGGAVRGAVVASLPVTDGPLQRRLADAVLFVPEGLAVVRIVEVERQHGIVTASPEGAWTISPDGGPGEVLQLSGGGSSPLDGLMRAGMDAAVRLRRAGLEPGRIARLTVLVGPITGLVPADGDLGEGDHVATTEPRSLLLGIARSARYSAVDNPRVWTTADVRAALEALGLAGRGPSVEELNGEGFAYSPYVLRRPELLTPAAMTAASTAPPPAAAPEAVVPAPAPAPVPPPVAPVPPVVPTPFTPVPAPVGVPAGIAAGSPVGGAAPRTEPAIAPPGAAWAPPGFTATTPVGAPVVAPGPGTGWTDPGAPRDDTGDTGGIGGLFAGAERAPAGGPGQLPAAPHTAVLAGQWGPPAAPPPGAPASDQQTGRSGRRVLALVVAALVVLGAVAVGGIVLLTKGLHRSAPAASSTSAPRATAPQPAIGSTQTVDGQTFTLQALKVDSSCVGHAYGQVAGLLATTPCTGLSRALYSTVVGGHEMVVAVSHTRMPSASAAAGLKSMADSSGTGNVSDLLREGMTWTGGPTRLGSASEYASKLVQRDVVAIVETAWVAPSSGGTADQLDTAAENGVDLPVPAFAG